MKRSPKVAHHGSLHKRERACRSASPHASPHASPRHADADLSRPVEVVTDMGKSRRFGLTAHQATDQAFLDLFDQTRADDLTA